MSLNFQIAVGKYSGFLYDQYGQGIGGSDFPDEEKSFKDEKGNFYLVGSHGMRLAVVKANGKVSISF